MNFFRHFNLVRKHRKEVRRLCFKCGLYWQGITHDLSKFSMTEFIEGIKYFDGTKSPISVCRKQTGISYAWLHHKGRNKHHPEYWIDNDTYLMMPYKYAVESLCDRISACKTYNGVEYTDFSPLKYWKQQKAKKYKINPNTALFFDVVLNDLATYGEKKVLNSKYLIEKYNNCIKEK